MEVKNNLIHKLSKYQTLYSTSNQNKYREKIDYYTKKLNSTGMSNIHYGGGDDDTTQLDELIQSVKSQPTSSADVTQLFGINDDLVNAVTDLEKNIISHEKYKQTIETKINELKKLIINKPAKSDLLYDRVNAKYQAILISKIVGKLKSLLTGSEKDISGVKVNEATDQNIEEILKQVGKMNAVTELLKDDGELFKGLKQLLDDFDTVTGKVKKEDENEEKFKDYIGDENNTPDLRNFTAYNIVLGIKKFLEKLKDKIKDKIKDNQEFDSQTVVEAYNKLVDVVGADGSKKATTIKPQEGGRVNKNINKYKLNLNLNSNRSIDSFSLLDIYNKSK